MIPELNKKYNYFDDGKISNSRRDVVIVTDVVCFNKIDKKTKYEWLAEVEQCHWLYNKKLIILLKGDCKI